MIPRVLVLAVLALGCSKSRVGPADASVEAAVVDAGSEKAITDAGPKRPLPDSLSWSTKAKTLAYLRGDELFVVDSDRFMVKMRTLLPHLSLTELVTLDRGGALLFGSEGEKFDAMQKVVVVDAMGTFKTVELGTQRSVPLNVDESGRVLSPAVIDEDAQTFTRLLVIEDEDSQKPLRLTMEVRAIADGAVKTTVTLPTWFHGRMNMPPALYGCRGSICAFGVAPPGAKPTFDDDSLHLALFDLKERAPKLLSSVVLGSGGIAFGKDTMIAVTHGAGSDPILVDSKTLAVRGLGRRGTKADPMQSAACVAFSADGSLLASTADGEPVTLFETATGKRRWKSPEDAHSVAHWRQCGVKFAADGHVLDYSNLGNMQKLDVATGKRLNEFQRGRMHNTGHPVAVGNESWLTSGTLSSQGSFFFLTDREKTNVMLDTRTWKESPFLAAGTFDPEDRFFIAGQIAYDATTLLPIAGLF